MRVAGMHPPCEGGDRPVERKHTVSIPRVAIRVGILAGQVELGRHATGATAPPRTAKPAAEWF